MKTNRILAPLEKSDKEQFMSDMSEAFQFYAEEGLYLTNEQILPIEEIEQTLGQTDAVGYKAVQNSEIVGGAIVVIDEQHRHGSLELLYVKRGIQSKGIGRFIWFEIEQRHPHIAVWETITPAFTKRNIHFYVNVCGFQITEYFNPHHPNPHPQPNYDGPDDDFHFKKIAHTSFPTGLGCP